MEPEVPAAASDVQDNHTADEGVGAHKKAESIVKVGHVDIFDGPSSPERFAD